ncbi:uncharacterized protein EKO05_0003555 [Ascochyta rabiei]|uniref:Uncharacterized protein n=1 Tax=Didymella rabiei TaxID=5454 RepID=A0A163ABE0_DIDRA|nr:uncharacterized protein EKO05_0003555 [Ascochyta rabiei]KZM21094.1 hypothetical protein ST47_g7782 [Ascochyta rabiei]UPX13026.1 hypothetical protein EKO05_0003555 [Ascochyta rabiei]
MTHPSAAISNWQMRGSADMAANVLYSHSPQMPDLASSRPHGPGPITPVHSPHHSVHSSTSLGTPLHTLSLHEYRKQQSTPLARVATPAGKTLRRKAAASALNEIERVSSTKLAHRHDSHSSSQPLHFSRSAHQLALHDRVFDLQPVPDQVLRSQSAEPRTQGGSLSRVATVDLHEKVRQFGSRKRLPRPSAPTGSGLHFPSNVSVRPTRQTHAPPPGSLPFLADESKSSDLQPTVTPSTISLSRFPKPPHFETPRETLREKALSFATTAPVTPPATPATIHYRGASFDLLNPHASLQYHDIVTPSRDFESSELLPLRSAQESLLSLSEMAPKRPLYGDLSAAHAGIVRRAEDFYGSSVLDLPLPPTPAAISPGSSTYTSPLYSPESHFAPSPLAVKKAHNESRFSFRQLTRTLTKKISKAPEKGAEEELQQFRGRCASGVSFDLDEEPLRPPEQTYIPAERASYFPVSPVSPTSPTSPASLHDLGSISGDDDDDFEYARGASSQNYELQGLTSMVPSDPSTQIGRADDSGTFLFAPDQGSRPYYDDLASIYASSSVYTGDECRKSIYQQGSSGNRRSSLFLQYSGMDAAGHANEYSYSNLARSSRPISRPLTQDLHHLSVVTGDGKTDTISKFIDQYDPGNTTTNSVSTQDVEVADTFSLIAPYMGEDKEGSRKDCSQTAALVPGLSQFESTLGHEVNVRDIDQMGSHMQRLTKERLLNRKPGRPPSAPAPLAPAFQYNQLPHKAAYHELSDMFSGGSHASYGDTRNLLQLPQSEIGGQTMFKQDIHPSSSYSQLENRVLEPSSSYSQAEEGNAGPQTPQEALDQAELIFKNAVTELEPDLEDIPAMWGKRSSVNLLRSRRLTDGSVGTADDEKADWETVAGGSQQGRVSLDSIADYSSSEGSRNSLGMGADGSLPLWMQHNHARGPSNYSHPSPLRTHAHPFSSSPPQLSAQAGSHTAPDMSTPDQPSSPPVSLTVPVFRFSTPRRAVDEPYALTPWADPYALSDKETQELLASGPNDDILFESEGAQDPQRMSYKFKSHGGLPGTSSAYSIDGDAGLERENTFDKLTVVGPKGNLTGTPRGTGMHDAGSSVADTSSPGARFSSSVGHHSPRSDYDGFYASPFPAAGSVTRIRQSRIATGSQHERSPSQVTLFPNAESMEPVQVSSPLAGPDRSRSLRGSTTFKPARRTSRAAVPGQTKLRQMVLAPDARTTTSSQDTSFSPFVSVSGFGRPSTCDTATPLHPTHPSLDTFPTIRSGKSIIAHQHSPHLLRPEREVKEEDEVRRRKLSWVIFACFCILPPCMFLYRMWGDSIIVSITDGELGHCTARSKRAALIAGIVVNIGLITAILVPILVAQAFKAI